jgi:pre-mRNA-splicing factor 38A
LCDRAVELTAIGGTYGASQKPTPFLCLAFKMLQLAPQRDIVLEYLNYTDPGSDEDGDAAAGGEINDGQEDRGPAAVMKAKGDFKYLRALAAFYIRLTFDAVDIYKALEPLLTDYRKLRRRMRDNYVLTYMDQFVDDLLTKDRVCGTSLWKLPSRQQLEDLDMLEERISPLADEVEELDRDDESVGSEASHQSEDVDMASDDS